MTTVTVPTITEIKYLRNSANPYQLKVSLLDENAKVPKRAYASDAGLDLYSPVRFAIEPHKWLKVSTGVAMEIPEGYYGLVQAKSGLASKQGINSFGNVIDSSYRGPISVILMNYSDQYLHFGQGDKIAQLLILPCSLMNCVEVPYEELSQTERSSSGFGSTGSK